MKVIGLATFLIFLLHNERTTASSLNPRGRNVCSRSYTYNTYYSVAKQRVQYHNYRTCCKKVWGACLRRCTRYRTSLVTYYVNQLRVNQGTTYFCCNGYVRRGDACPQPVCRPACQNGFCQSPNRCFCRPGFTGSFCQSDINECLRNPCQQLCNNLRGGFSCSCRRGYRKVSSVPKDGKCQNVNECLSSNKLCLCAAGSSCKAQCVDTPGSYRCKCNQGYQLANNKICKDIDECKAGQHQCQQRCVNSLGGFQCACSAGYWLRADKKRCSDINECRRGNGGCEQTCTNIVGSYKCSCRSGYTLAYDKARCTDINECLTIKPCDKTKGVCQNTRGSYRCTCRAGYEIAEKNQCRDIDECKGANQCQHYCKNTDGSYYCTCRKGYVLSSDGRKCNDMDECKLGLHDCDHTCINTVGSYKCQCRPGYMLLEDKATCRAIPCKALPTPKFGRIQCSGLNYGQKCNYRCNAGFKLTGRSVRTCQLNSRWTGTAPRCQPTECPMLRPPLHGYLELPCVAQYNLSCTVKCNRGFTLEGDGEIKCGLVKGSVKWINNKATCKEIKLCKPNPCQNGGKCRLKLESGYECDCTGTSFEGDHCDVGSLRMPSFPSLVKDKSTGWIQLNAKPSSDLTIIPESVIGDVQFIPKKLKINFPLTSTKFKITPRSSGLIKVSYAMSGNSAKQFSKIPDSFLYVAPLDASEVFTKMPTQDFPKTQCHKFKLDRCSASKNVELVSSCPWTSNGTEGYQSVLVDDVRLPFSLAGVTLPEQGLNAWTYRKKGFLSVSREVGMVLKDGVKFCSKDKACKRVTYTKAEHRFIVQQNIFARSHLDALSQMMPHWIGLNVELGHSGFHLGNIQGLILKGHQMSTLKVCEHFPASINSGVFALQLLHVPLTLSHLSSESSLKSTYPSCVATDLCKKVTYISVPKDSNLDLTPDLRSMGIKHMQLRIFGAGFSKQAFDAVCTKTKGSGRDCLKGNAWLKIAGGLSFKNLNVSLVGEVSVSTDNLEEASYKRFSSEVKYGFKGKVHATMSVKAGGESIDIQVEDKASTGFGSFGPATVTSSHYGFTFQARSPVQMRQKSSLVSFRPDQSLGVFKTQALYGLQGGTVVGVSNQAKLRSAIRRMSMSARVVPGLLRVLRAKRSVFKAEYDALDIFSKTLSAAQNDMAKKTAGPAWNYRSVYEGILSLKKLTVTAIDIAALLKNRVPILETNYLRRSSILNQAKFFVRAMKFSETLSAVPKTIPLLENYSGKVITYAGKLCFHALCFDNLMVKVDDSGKGSDMLPITATFRESQTIGNQFKVAKGTKIHATVSKSLDQFKVKMDIIAKLFERDVSTTLEIDTSKVRFVIKGFKLVDNVLFDVEVAAANSKNTNWQNLHFKITGKASKGSLVVRDLENEIKNYIIATSNLIKERHQDAAKKVGVIGNELAALNADVREKKALLKTATANYHLLKAEYHTWATRLIAATETFNSYRVSDFFKNIEKYLNKRFPLAKCNDTCISVPVYCICQESVMVDADTLQCQLKDRQVITTVSVPSQAKCPLTDYRFTPIYTGTCRKSGGRSLSGALGGIGAGIGGIIGGPIGAGIGGLIGGFVGSLFGSSCSETYEVYKEVMHRQVDCTLKTFKPRKTAWKEAVCYNKVKSVLSGYGNPTECGCSNSNYSCVVTQDPACLASYVENVTARRAYVTTQMQNAGSFNDSFDKLLTAESKTRQTFKTFLQGEKKFLFAKKNYEKAAAIVKQANLEITFTNRSLSNFDENFALERCLSRVLIKASNRPLMVRSLTFEASAAAREQLLCSVTTERADVGHVTEKSILLDLRDFDKSMVSGAKLIAKRTFCEEKLRGKRSIGGKDDVKFKDLFVQGDTEVPENATSADKVCLVSTTALRLLERAASEFVSKLKATDKRRAEIQGSLNNIKGKIGQIDDSDVQDQNELLYSLENQLKEDVGRMKEDKLLKEWVDSMEIVTGASNLTRCLNFGDCIKESLRQLGDLPSMITVEKEEFRVLINKAENAFIDLFSSTSNKPLSAKARKLKRRIKKISEASAFCSKAPSVRLDKPPTVTVDSGSRLVIKCVTSSDKLKAKYAWSQNDVMLLAEDSDTLILNADASKEGAYKCIVSNIVGTNSSQETFVVVRKKPEFTSEPKDFLYYSSMPREIKAFFACNVTSDPPATIAWYFKGYKSNKVVQLASSKSVLRFRKPTKLDAGYYYCKAENEVGRIQSRAARLDVLKSSLPNQLVTLTYEMPLALGRSAGDKDSLAKRVAKEGNFTQSQQLNVSYEYKGKKAMNVFVNVRESLEAVSGESGLSEIDMLRRLSRSRIELSKKIENVVEALRPTRGRSASGGRGKLLGLSFNGELCPRGYRIHENGFTCLECQVGTFEQNGNCLKCHIGTYQDETGKRSCIPCSANQVTKERGAVNKFHCVQPELRKSDIIFVLDTSSSIGTANWNKVKQFVKKFAAEFVTRDNDLRLGVVTFGSTARLRIPLRSYNKNDFQRRVEYLSYYGGATMTFYGLLSADREFRRNYKPGRKRIVFVMTDGKSSSSKRTSGFTAVRMTSFRLLKQGMRVIAIGVGNNLNVAELKAMASFPKLDNTIQYNNFDQLITASKRISAEAYKSSCASLGRDVAVVVEATSEMSNSKWQYTRKFVERLLTKLASPENKISLSTFDKNLIVKRQFEIISTSAEVKKIITSMARSGKRDSNGFKTVLNRVYNELMTEVYNALSPTKIVVFITKDRFNRGLLNSVRRYYQEEEVHFLTVVVEDQGTDDENASLVFAGETSFTTKQLPDLVTVINSIQDGSQFCRAKGLSQLEA